MEDSIPLREVLVLFNRRSGGMANPWIQLDALSEWWDRSGINLVYQESKDPEDGKRKIRQAVARGIDTLIVAGGDGMINTVGAELVGKDVALAVIPAGSGNGFAGHFGIPLRSKEAAQLLRTGRRQRIDVGYAGDRPFFVTASLAWDADLVRGFQSSPVRGILPYVLAGIYHYFTYEPQDFQIELDGELLTIEKPMVLTVANLTQYGGGAIIAPEAQPDDGKLALVAVPRMEPLDLLSSVVRLFDGTVSHVPEIRTWSFQRMVVRRERPDPIQLDGELVDCSREIVFTVKPAALDVIVPALATGGSSDRTIAKSETEET
ncbi:hypothetical protein KKH27_12020 [bacterium]|nr:hypothetical protein [bacterium]